MSIFTAVKANVTARQVAEHAGIKVTRNGMAICPFHDDHNPSLKIDDRYFCFGCGAKGDAIDFEANYYGIGLKEAAERIASDFGISTYGDTFHNYKPVKPIETEQHRFFRLRSECIRELNHYSGWLQKQILHFAPTDPAKEFPDEYGAFFHQKQYIDYLLDLMNGFEDCTEADQKEIIEMYERGEFNHE